MGTVQHALCNLLDMILIFYQLNDDFEQQFLFVYFHWTCQCCKSLKEIIFRPISAHKITSFNAENYTMVHFGLKMVETAETLPKAPIIKRAVGRYLQPLC